MEGILDMLKDLYRRGKSLLSRPLTLLLVPPKGVKTKSFSMPFWLVVCFSLIVFILIAGCSWSYYSAWKARSDQRELAKLRKVNQQHQEELVALRQEAVEAKTYLEEVRGLDQRVREKVGIEEKTKSYSSRSASTSTKTPRYYFWKSYSKEELLTPLDVSQSIAEVSSESVEARQTLKSLEKDIDAHFAYLASLPDHWPVNGRMTSPFGNRKSPFGGGSIEFHDGIDLAADYGEPVSAAADGVVVYTGYRGGYGRTVIISHSLSGYKTSYCHLSKSLVKHGERVSKGQKIALAGSTGRSTGPHLHFIVEKDGVLLDPLSILN